MTADTEAPAREAEAQVKEQQREDEAAEGAEAMGKVGRGREGVLRQRKGEGGAWQGRNVIGILCGGLQWKTHRPWS